jgi:hypothetical protein
VQSFVVTDSHLLVALNWDRDVWVDARRWDAPEEGQAIRLTDSYLVEWPRFLAGRGEPVLEVEVEGAPDTLYYVGAQWTPIP